MTYFFNGGREEPWPGEERVLVPSPKVATYDLAPEMSAAGVTDALVDAIESDQYDFIIANFANADMVGHTGNWDATVRGLEALDVAIGRVAAAMAGVDERDPGSLLVITADHGNADELRDADGNAVTAHSLNPVPIVAVGRPFGAEALHDGVLADVAPDDPRARGPAGVAGRHRVEPARPGRLIRAA